MRNKAHLGLLLMLAAAPLCSQEKTPSIAFLNGTIREFGKVAAGESLVHVFRFTNRGQAPLEVLQVRPT
jgi:hypothetical protein